MYEWFEQKVVGSIEPTELALDPPLATATLLL